MYASVYECIFTLEVGNHIHIRKLKSEHFLVLGKKEPYHARKEDLDSATLGRSQNEIYVATR